MQNTKGFTLLELLIAISIFLVLATIAYSGLDSLINTKMAVEQQSDDLAELQKVFLNLQRDFEQVVPRSIREGQTRKPAIFSSSSMTYIVEFSRTGLTNPTGLSRSNLQRVAYEIQDDQLVRLHWPNLDRRGSEKPFERVLLSGVYEMQIEFLNEQDRWLSFWPPTALIEEGEDFYSVLPKGVNVTLNLEKWGKINRLFPLVNNAGENGWVKGKSDSESQGGNE